MPALAAVGEAALNIATVLVILVGLVVAHEFGHFVAARLAGVRVHEFGIGLPPRAFTFARGKETIYTLNWLPLGGFVRLEGEDGDTSDPRSFSRQSLRVRTAILLAGVLMNFLLAWLIFSLIAGFADPTTNYRISTFTAPLDNGQLSPAERAGLHGGKLTQVTPAGNIYDASGDLIIAIDGQQFAWFDAGATGAPDGGLRYLRAHAGETVTLTVKHADGTVAQVPLKLNPADLIEKQGALGVKIGFERGPDIQRPPLEAVSVGARRTVQASLLVLNALRDLVSNFANPPVAGPIGIVSVVGQVREFGPPNFLVYLIGLLSANLAVINALPIPPMDGGRVLVGVIKTVTGNRISLNAERATYFVGFALLLAFIFWISYFDIQRLGGGS